MSDRQGVFDKALSHMRQQGRKSVVGAGCSYRGVGGLKCAIGIFIPDRQYGLEMESHTVDCTCVYNALPKSVRNTGEQFLCDVQGRLHDDLSTNYFLYELEFSARDLAIRYDLKYSAPEATP